MRQGGRVSQQPQARTTMRSKQNKNDEWAIDRHGVRQAIANRKLEDAHKEPIYASPIPRPEVSLRIHLTRKYLPIPFN
jgi:hypothetical protein